MRRLSWLVPLVAFTAAGCFATRNDVRLLQLNIVDLHRSLDSSMAANEAAARAARLAQARRDSAHTADLGRLELALGIVSDSLASIADGLSKFRASQTEENYQQGQAILKLYAAVWATNKQMADVQSALAQSREARDTTTAKDTTHRAVPALSSASMLFQNGMEQLRQSRPAAARNAFEELLKDYPNDSRVPAALLQLGVSYTMDGNDVAADSAYASVVERYPKSDAAPTALYKRALALEKAQPREARALYQRVVSEYPGSDEAPLAADRIKSIPPH